MASTIGRAALGWKVVLQHLHHVLTLLGRLLHEQLVDFQVDRGLKAVKIGQNNNPNHSKGRLYTISFKPDDKTIPRGIGAHSKTLLLLPGSNGSEPLAFIGEVIKKIKTNKQTNCTGIFLCLTLSTTITSYKKTKTGRTSSRCPLGRRTTSTVERDQDRGQGGQVAY